MYNKNMLDSLILNKQSIESIYKTIKDFHKKYLNSYGVKLPRLYGNNRNFTRDALVLVYLAYDYPQTRKVTKRELTKFIRSYYPDTNDVQQARHLGAQSGWYIFKNPIWILISHWWQEILFLNVKNVIEETEIDGFMTKKEE